MAAWPEPAIMALAQRASGARRVPLNLATPGPGRIELHAETAAGTVHAGVAWSYLGASAWLVLDCHSPDSQRLRPAGAPGAERAQSHPRGEPAARHGWMAVGFAAPRRGEPSGAGPSCARSPQRDQRAAAAARARAEPHPDARPASP